MINSIQFNQIFNSGLQTLQRGEGMSNLMIQQMAMSLNQALRVQNRNKIMQILALPEAGQIMKVEDENKYIPLFWACSSLEQNFALEVVPIMLDKGADPYKIDNYKENVLYYIAKGGKDRLLKYMLDRFKYDLTWVDLTRQTPLFFASSNNHINCASVLIEKGADVNHIDSNGQNCLFWAASGGHLEMCKFLVNKGINYQKVDFNKETSLHYAKKNKHPAIIAYLQELKSNQKKTKQMLKVESSQPQEKGPRKKKQLMKQKYCLIYTSQKGEVRELTLQQLQQFARTNDQNRKIMDLIYYPDKLDSMAVPEQKKFQKIANKILNHFVKHQQGPIFLYPVDYVAMNIPHYPNVVKNPMDFTTIRTKLSYNAYDNETDFNYDMNLVFDNCILFNGPESAYGKIATQMKLQFNTMYKKQYML